MLFIHQNKWFFKILICFFITYSSTGQQIPEIIKGNNGNSYLPDFSYAGYQFGEKSPDTSTWQIVNAVDFGVNGTDTKDDSESLINTIEFAKSIQEPVVIQLPPGKIILSEIIYLERSFLVLRGTGSGENGTELYFPRPLMYIKNSESLKELREYLVTFDKRQIEKDNNINLPFSQYSWSGGFIWIQAPEERVKAYLDKYDTQPQVVAKITHATRGEHILYTKNSKNVKVGDVLRLELFNKTGEHSKLIKDLYKETDVKVGSHHYNFPDMPLVRQQVVVTRVTKNSITIKSPVTLTILPEYGAQLTQWNHLKEVGIEHLRIHFPKAPKIAHHVEMGFNGIYLTRLYNGWVNDVQITNADSGILTENIANVSITNIVTNGDNIAHYSVAISGAYNTLVANTTVKNYVIHPLSFNTFATKCVYQNCEVFTHIDLDQHSGANHQNLFDNIKVWVTPEKNNQFPLFAGGGAGYWKPAHGAYSTFWNIDVHFLSGLASKNPIRLYGMNNGPFANLIGIHANHPITIDYGPDAYIEFRNKAIDAVPSLYDYQLKQRLKNEK